MTGGYAQRRGTICQQEVGNVEAFRAPLQDEVDVIRVYLRAATGLLAPQATAP